MFKLSAVVATALLLSNTGLAQAEKPALRASAAQPLAASLDALLAPQFKPDEPGATVIVVKDGKTVLRKAYGLADTAGKTPMTPHTVLRLGSITKQFTAVAILMLADEGKLQLDDPITRFFPDYPMQGKVITIEHLLTHSSGIVSYTGKPGFGKTMTQNIGVARMIEGFRNDPLEFEPGTQYRYNNSGYFLLGAIIEKVSGQPYARFVEQRIFTPLGMNDTAHEGFERSRAPHAAGHSRTDDGFGASAPLSMSQPYAAGALVSTVDDLARWDAAIAAGKLLTPASWKKAFTAYQLAPGKSANYGYGWHVGTLRGVPMIDHGGGINGFRSYALRLPEQKVFVAVLANADSGNADPEVLALKAAALAIGKPYADYREVAVDPRTLHAFAGVYATDSAEGRRFTVRDGTLVMQRGKGRARPLKAFSHNGFFIPNTLARFEFERDAGGKATHVTMIQGDDVLRTARIDETVAPQ